MNRKCKLNIIKQAGATENEQLNFNILQNVLEIPSEYAVQDVM